MKKKILIILGVIIVILGCTLGTWYFIKNKNETGTREETPPPVEEQVEIPKSPIQINIEEELEAIIIKYLKLEYPEAISWELQLKDQPDGFKISASLKLLHRDFMSEEDYNKFYTPYVTCDEEKTMGILSVTKDNKTYEANLFCDFTLT